MADAGDRTPATSRGLPGAVPSVRSGTSDEAYRPLSGLALAGFFLAGAYALIVIGGGLLSFFGGFPWLLPGWVHLIAIGGLGLSWVARNRILDAEGVLSGAALANWGVAMTLLCATLYFAYYTATYFAVRAQAAQFANQYFDHIKKGEIDKAFLLSIRPPRVAPNAADLRERLENLYNTPGPAPGFAPGPFSGFTTSDHCRLVHMGGDNAAIEPLGVRDWDFREGGYRVHLVYRVTTPADRADYIVTVQSAENPREFQGRQWYVIRDDTGILKQGNRQITADGQAIFALGDEAAAFATNWLARLESGDRSTTYLESLPPADRAAQKAGAAELASRRTCGLVAGCGAIAAASPGANAYERGHRAFLAGEMVAAQPPQFWAPSSLRPRVVADALRCFAPPVAGERLPSFSVSRSGYPSWIRDGERLQFQFDVTLRGPERLLEGQLLVSARVPDLHERTRRLWKVDGLRLVRGRSTPTEGSQGTPR